MNNGFTNSIGWKLTEKKGTLNHLFDPLTSTPIIRVKKRSATHNINKYVKSSIEKLIVLIAIYLSNIFYGLGTIIYFFGLRKFIERKIYRSIKTEKVAK